MKRTHFLVFVLVLGSLQVLSGCGTESSSSEAEAPAVLVTHSQPETSSKQNELEQRFQELHRKTGHELTRATDLYGPLMVSQGSWYAQADHIPWTAYWYPLWDDVLFKNEDSTLRKFDQYVQTIQEDTPSAAEYEKLERFRPNSVDWAGRCDAMALASVMEPDPTLKKPVTINGVTFTTQDLKALLILTYEEAEGLIQFGQRSNGDYYSIPEDIYPEQFHRVLQKILIEERKPFIMDKDPGVAVWNTPVYAVNTNIVRDPVDPYLFHVETALQGILYEQLQTSARSITSKAVVFEYTYDLYGFPTDSGDYQVMFGVWTGSSREDHPDFLWTLESKGPRKSRNPAIKVDLVDDLIIQAKLQDS